MRIFKIFSKYFFAKETPSDSGVALYDSFSKNCLLLIISRSANKQLFLSKTLRKLLSVGLFALVNTDLTRLQILLLVVHLVPFLFPLILYFHICF